MIQCPRCGRLNDIPTLDELRPPPELVAWARSQGARIELTDDPAKVNADPQGDGWFFKLEIADKAEFAKLMTDAQYAEFVKGL